MTVVNTDICVNYLRKTESCVKMSNDLNCVCMRDRTVCNCNRPSEIEQKESRNCLCGRSPNGKCMSWHALSEKVYLQRKSHHELSAS